jgi:deoxycytidylate deaminase
LHSQAATKSKIENGKERLVLMPLRLDEADKSRQAAMEVALLEGLQQKYEVSAGEKVAKKSRDIFNKESHNTTHNECDETRCLQNIAEAFQAELIAVANVSKQDDGYFLALTVRNIFDDKVVYSKSTPCEHCNAYQVVDKLKEISNDSIISTTKNDGVLENSNQSPQQMKISAEDCFKLYRSSNDVLEAQDDEGLEKISLKMINFSCKVEESYVNLINAQIGLKKYKAADKTYRNCVNFNYSIPVCHMFGAQVSLLLGNSNELTKRAKIAHSLFGTTVTRLERDLTYAINSSDTSEQARIKEDIRYLKSMNETLLQKFDMVNFSDAKN